MATAMKEKSAAQKDVYTLINGKIIEQLQKGIVPWRTQWIKGGIPTNIYTRNVFRGLNAILLTMLGYGRNLFITEKQLKEYEGGAIKPGERPHMLASWNYKNEEGEATANDGNEKKERTGISYYSVYNIAQCVGVSYEMEAAVEIFPFTACEEMIANMPHPPMIKHKEPLPYYQPMDDLVNMPKKTSFKNEAEFFEKFIHQLVHSTGHHTRLNRIGLVQMPEFGCEPYTLEELVAEIATCSLLSHVGITSDFEPTSAYLLGWIDKFSKDKYMIFNAATLAQKAVDFIIGSEPQVEEAELAEEAVAA